MENLDIIPIAMIVGYLTLVTVIGSMLSKRSKSAKDWAGAGAGMGTFMLAVGIAGTRIGGAGTYGVAGNVITGGVWYMWWYAITTMMAMALVAFFFAKPYRRLKIDTVGEVFSLRFKSRRTQVLTSLCVQTEYFIVDVIEVYLIGAILSTITGMPYGLAVLIAAGVVITYTALGGLWGSAATNLIHCGVILLGLFAVAWMGLREIGDWESVRARVSEQLAARTGPGPSEAAWWGLAGAGWGAVLGIIFSSAVHTPAASVYVNFSSAARRERNLVPAFLLAGCIASLMPLLAGWIGIETLAKYGAEAGLSSFANITKLATDINPWIGGVALAAVLAAIISSAGPILLSSATMFVRDWLPFTRKYTDAKRLRAFRIATICYGLVSALVAYLIRDLRVSVLDLLLFGFAMVVPPAIVLGYLIYWKGTTEAGAFWGMLLAYAGGLLWFVLIKWALRVEFEAPAGSGFFRRLIHTCFVYKGKGIDPSYATTFLPLALVPIISWFTRQETEKKDSFYAALETRVAEGE